MKSRTLQTTVTVVVFLVFVTLVSGIAAGAMAPPDESLAAYFRRFPQFFDVSCPEIPVSMVFVDYARAGEVVTAIDVLWDGRFMRFDGPWRVLDGGSLTQARPDFEDCWFCFSSPGTKEGIVASRSRRS